MNTNLQKLRFNLNINGAIVYAAFLVFLFTSIYYFTGKGQLTVVMNAFIFGAILSLFVTYSRYIYYAFAGQDPWNRARQFGVSTAILWAAIWIVIAASIIRHSGTSYNVASTNFLDYVFRYLVIIAATLQVFSPDYGEGLFFSAERKTLIWGSIIGLAVSVFLIVMQAENFLG